jgi:hypothetical protein
LAVTKSYWSMPFDAPNAADRAIAVLRRRDELGGGDAAFVCAAAELEPSYFMSADEFIADLRAGAIVGAPAMPEDFE